MARIAIDARTIYTSTGRYVERLINRLQTLDPTNEYIVLLSAKDYARWQPSAPNFSKVVADYPPYTLREQLHYAWQLYRLKADLVHFAEPHLPILYRRPYVATIHDLTLVDYINKRRESPLKDFYKQHLKPRAFKLMLTRITKQATHIITPTDYVRTEVIKRYHVDPTHISFTHEAAEVLTSKPKAPSTPIAQPFILFVGNAFPYKNLRRLIDAFANLNDPKLSLVLAGKTSFFYEELARYVQEHGIARVIMPGFVNDAELGWLYQHAKLYVFPSLSEGFGLPPLEAMQYGLPVVAASATCLPEVLGDAAVYFDPRDAADMTRVIRETLADSKRMVTLKQAGQKRIKQFSWQRMAEQTLAIYNDALK